jgi:hypothetical protein
VGVIHYDEGINSMDQKLEKWGKWIAAIDNDMVSLATSRLIYEETKQIIINNSALAAGPTVFFNCLVRWYVDSAIMGLRRHLKIDGDSISLAGLLQDIAGTPKFLSRTHFVSLSDKPEMHPHLNRTFDKYAGQEAEYVSSEAVKQELDEFRKRSKRCETYADRLVAHLDKHSIKDLPTFQEFYDAVDFAETLLKKYTLLIRGSSLLSVTPVVLEDWMAIFRVP